MTEGPGSPGAGAAEGWVAPVTMSGWEAVLFDLDGTLADTVPLILASYRHTMTVHRGAPGPDEDWLRHVGRPLRETVRHFARDDAEADAIRETYVGFQREAHDRMVRPFQGIGEVVRGLALQGVRLAVVTSKIREMTGRTLQVCRVDDCFPVVITADDVVRGKPDPEPVHRALEALGGPDPTATLFVGDSPHDMAAGKAAGVRTAAVTWGAFPAVELAALEPDFLVHRPSELLELARP